MDFNIPEGIDFADMVSTSLEIHCRILGSSKIWKQKVITNSRIKRTVDESRMKKGDIDEVKYFYVDHQNKSIYFNNGLIIIDEDLLIPEGYSVYVQEGTVLDLVQESAILTYSPLYMLGYEDNPVLIISSDSTGRGLKVIDSGKRSQFRFVHFKDIPGNSGPGIHSMISFINSTVRLDHCYFNNQTSEAADIAFLFI